MNDEINSLRKKLIIETAGKYFQEFDYEKVRIENVSKELSIGVGTIYSYFGSKEGLFHAWLEYVIDMAREDLLAKNVVEPIEKLTWFVEYRLSYYLKNKKSLREYIYNNKLRYKGEDPMSKIYLYLAEGLEPLCAEGANLYLYAHILDSLINCYIKNCPNDLLSKRDDIVRMFLRVLDNEK